MYPKEKLYIVNIYQTHIMQYIEFKSVKSLPQKKVQANLNNIYYFFGQQRNSIYYRKLYEGITSVDQNNSKKISLIIYITQVFQTIQLYFTSKIEI